jgi:tripartite-type tricarboxylate transporter receptor subunit TctC
MTMKPLTPLIVAGLLMAQPLPTGAQDYPTRQVTIVIPVPPGGGADMVTRVLAQKLSERLGRPFVVENRPGAGLVSGTASVARAAPDGYTLLMGTSTPLAINATLFKKLPYDPAKDFVPIAHVTDVPFVLVVHPSLGVHSLADLVKLAQSKPGKLTYASAGPGTPHHLFMELLKSMTGIDMLHVPYKGTPPALTDLLAGRHAAMFSDLPPSLPSVSAGKLHALGVSTLTRSPAAPTIAPIADAGLSGFDAAAWLMMVAPANTPDAIVTKLHAELTTIMALPEVRDRLAQQGMIPVVSGSPETLRRFVRTEIGRWGEVVAKSGATAE